MTPEQAVKAHHAVNGKIIIPTHWGTFDLAFHSWHEPIERFTKAAAQADANLRQDKNEESFRQKKRAAEAALKF